MSKSFVEHKTSPANSSAKKQPDGDYFSISVGSANHAVIRVMANFHVYTVLDGNLIHLFDTSMAEITFSKINGAIKQHQDVFKHLQGIV